MEFCNQGSHQVQNILFLEGDYSGCATLGFLHDFSTFFYYPLSDY